MTTTITYEDLSSSVCDSEDEIIKAVSFSAHQSSVKLYSPGLIFRTGNLGNQNVEQCSDFETIDDMSLSSQNNDVESTSSSLILKEGNLEIQSEEHCSLSDFETIDDMNSSDETSLSSHNNDFKYDSYGIILNKTILESSNEEACSLSNFESDDEMSLSGHDSDVEYASSALNRKIGIFQNVNEEECSLCDLETTNDITFSPDDKEVESASVLFLKNGIFESKNEEECSLTDFETIDNMSLSSQNNDVEFTSSSLILKEGNFEMQNEEHCSLSDFETIDDMNSSDETSDVELFSAYPIFKGLHDNERNINVECDFETTHTSSQSRLPKIVDADKPLNFENALMVNVTQSFEPKSVILWEKCFMSALLLYMKCYYKLPTTVMQGVLRLIKCFKPSIHIPQSMYICVSTITKHIFNFRNSFHKENNIIFINLEVQFQFILNRQLHTIIKHHHHLNQLSDSSDEKDILGMHPAHKQCLENKFEISDKGMGRLNIHFILCSDGTNVCRFKNYSYWPIYLMIADLPLHIRQKSENMLVYALSREKPNWSNCFANLKTFISNEHSFVFPENSDANIYCKDICNPHMFGKSVTVTVKFEVVYLICDLPALSSITNCTQFNGKFGCPKCYHPSKRIDSLTIYPHIALVPLRSDDEHLINEVAATISKTRVFGVKGYSFLKDIINIPSGIILDPMHFMFEGIMKQFINLCLDPHYSYFPLYLGRPSVLKMISETILKIAVPHDFPKFRSLTKQKEDSNIIQPDIAFLKAHDLKYMLFYSLLPILTTISPPLFSLHFALFVYAVRTSFLPSLNNEDINNVSKCISLFQKLLKKLEFPDKFFTINLHLLNHFSDQLKTHGPAYSVTMFAFESENKTLKGFCHGTVAYDDQIVEALLMRNVLQDYLNNVFNDSRCTAFKSFISSLIPTLNINFNFQKSTNQYSQNQHVIVLDAYRIKIHGIIYHSLNYPRRRESASHLFCTKDGKHGKIIEFNTSESIISAKVAFFKCFSFVEFLFEKLFHSIDDTVFKVYSYLKYLDSFYQFQVFQDSDEEVVIIPVSDFLCRCILVDLKYSFGTYHCIVPCIEMCEKK
jgi:Domain of unknown function (DUF4218)